MVLILQDSTQSIAYGADRHPNSAPSNTREGSDAPADGCFWDDSAARHAPADIRDKVELARRFSLHTEGMPLLYNLLLAERFRTEHGGDDERIDLYMRILAYLTGFLATFDGDSGVI